MLFIIIRKGRNYAYGIWQFKVPRKKYWHNFGNISKDESRINVKNDLDIPLQYTKLQYNQI